MLEIMKKSGWRTSCAFCANLLIAVLECIAFILSYIEHGAENFCFYTQDSNYLAMAASLLYCIYAVKEAHTGMEPPKWLHSFRYITVCCLMLTLFVVLIILMPMAGENALFMLYGGSMLFQHTLCPILAAVSFFLFERKVLLPGREALKAMVPTLLYAMITITLNIFRVMEGPYPFLMVYRQPWYMSMIWCFVILGIAEAIALAALKLCNFICRKSG